MAIDELEENYDDDLYTDTSMFDADEIVRSVEEVAKQRNGEDAESSESARKRFERMMEERSLAEKLKDSYDDD